MNRSWGIYDQSTAIKADRRGAAVHLPQLGLHRVGDQLDDFVGPGRCGVGGISCVVGRRVTGKNARAAAASTPAAAGGLALRGTLQAQIWRAGVIRGLEQKILDRIRPAVEQLVRGFLRGDFEHAFFDRICQHAIARCLLQDQIQNLYAAARRRSCAR